MDDSNRTPETVAGRRPDRLASTAPTTPDPPPRDESSSPSDPAAAASPAASAGVVSSGNREMELDAESEAEFQSELSELSELAEAYEASLLTGDADEDVFSREHPDLAQMLRLLNGVLGEGSRLDAQEDPSELSLPEAGSTRAFGPDTDGSLGDEEARDAATGSASANESLPKAARPSSRDRATGAPSAFPSASRASAGNAAEGYLAATQSHPGLPNDGPAPTVLPESLGRFELRECLGQGGYGAVYRGYDTLLKRDVAIKVVHASRIGRNSAFSSIDMVLHEARNVAQLRHPNIVSVYDAVLTEPYLYLVYELCDGSTLSFWMEMQREEMDPALAARIVEQLADALDHAHQRGMVHRDIKPDNILIDKSSEGANRLPFTARLADFGLAMSDEGIDAPGRTPSPIDKAGTLEYLPPERLLDGASASSPRGDLYSLGVVFYRLLTGQLPIEPDKPLVFLHKLGQASIQPPRKVRSSIPRDLDAICMKLLARDPRQRYSSARKLAEDLLRFRMGLSVSVRRRSPREHLLQFFQQFPVEAASLTSTVLMALLAGGALALLYTQLVRQQDQLEEDQQRAMVAERRAAKMSMEANVQERRAEEYLQFGVRAAYASDLPTAYASWQMRQSTRALRLLDQIAERNLGRVAAADDLRLLRAVVSRDQQLMQSHGVPATHLALTPDGQQLVASFDKGELIFQDLKTLRTPQRMSLESPRPITSFALDRSGEYVTLAGPWAPGGQPEVRVVSTKSGKILAAHRHLPGPVKSLAFTPDGRSLLVACDGHAPRILAPLDSSARQRTVPASPPDSLAFSTCDPSLIAVGTRTELQLYDASSRQLQQTLPLPAAPRCVAWTKDLRWLAVALNDRTEVWVFDLEVPERPEYVLAGGEEPAQCLAFSANAGQLAAGSVSGQVTSWRLPTAVSSDAESEVSEGFRFLHPSQTQRLHAGSTLAVLALSDTKVVSAGADGTVVLSSPRTPWTAPSLPAEASLETASVSGNGQYLAVGTAEGEVHVVDLAMRATVYRLAANQRRATHLAFVETQLPELLVRWDDGRLVHLDARGEPRQTLVEGGSTGDGVDDAALAVSPFAHAAALLDSRQGLRVWNLRDASSPPRQAMLPGGGAMRFLGSHERLLVSPASQPLLLARVLAESDQAAPVMAVPFPSARDVTCVLFDPLRQRVLCGDLRGNLQMIDPEARTVLATASAPDRAPLPSPARAPNPSPASTSAAGDAPPPAEAPLAGSSLTSLELTADGSSILAGHEDGSVRVWSASDLRFVGTLLPADARGAIVMLRATSRGDQLYLFRKRPGQPSTIQALDRISMPRDDLD